VRLRRKSDGQLLVLADSDLLGKGGEARVYRVPNDPSLVAKIWHKPTPERAAKIEVMVANPPSNPTAAQKHTSIAWPTEILQSGSGASNTVGFLMPFVGGMSPVIDFFNPKTRRSKCPLFNYFYLHRTARNLVIAIRALHERNYVIGDLNESNVLVAETALVSIVDTDSFQVWDGAKGKLYRCRVGKPEFTPPEIQGKTFGQVDRGIQQDLFGLGIILFQLLMEGTHPFAGNYTGPGEAPPYEGRIAAGHFPYAYGRKVPYVPKKTAPSFSMLYPALQHLFIRCFEDGHFQPNARPDTEAWQWALEEAENSLVSCWVNDQHIYSGHLQECPWCARTKLLGGRDPFPSVESVKTGKHLGPAVSPPKSFARSNAAPLQRSPTLPLPPLPTRVPASTSGYKSTSRQTTSNRPAPFAGFPGPRNDWAWIGLAFGILAVLTLKLPGLPYFLGVLAIMCSGYGEIVSHGWYLDGKGAIPARIGMALGGIPVLIHFVKMIYELGA
jgi:DNA-binding helix-hairpin-helix protein with protein kinase domain